MDKDLLNLISLLDFDRNSYGIDGRLNEDLLVFVSGNCNWVQKKLRIVRVVNFYLWSVVSFNQL